MNTAALICPLEHVVVELNVPFGLAFSSLDTAKAGIAMATIMAAITNAAVTTNIMRLMSVTSSFCFVLGNPLVGLLVLYEGDDGPYP